MMEWNSISDFYMEDSLLSESDFIAGFHAIGEERYHHKHPFHLLMHEGKLTRGQLQSWASIAIITRVESRSKTQPSSREPTIPTSGVRGANASSIMMVTARVPAASRSGFA